MSTAKEIFDKQIEELKNLKKQTNENSELLTKIGLTGNILKKAQEQVVNNFRKAAKNLRNDDSYKEAMKLRSDMFRHKKIVEDTKKEKEILQKEYQEKLAQVDKEIASKEVLLQQAQNAYGEEESYEQAQNAYGEEESYKQAQNAYGEEESYEQAQNAYGEEESYEQAQNAYGEEESYEQAQNAYGEEESYEQAQNAYGEEESYEQAQIAHGGKVEKQTEGQVAETLTQEPEPEITESIDTPAEVLEFRRGFVDGIEEDDDVTREKLEKIVEIGEKLVQSKEFHFEKSAYGEIGVLKLGGKTMKFLNIPHPQDFNNQLTHEIEDIILYKNYDYKEKCSCWCNNTQDLVSSCESQLRIGKYVGIEELLGKVKDSTGLGQLTRVEMEDTVRRILKYYCNQNGVIFDNEDDYMLLYMYLMGPNGGYGRQWLSDGGNLLSDGGNLFSDYFECDCAYRWFNSNKKATNNASLFFGSVV